MTRRIVSAELEDRVLRVVVATCTRRRVRVERTTSLTLAGDDAPALAAALRDAAAGLAPQPRELVLTLRHRRITCGEVPADGNQDAAGGAERVARAARTLGVHATDEDLVVGYLPRARGRAGMDVCVAPRQLVENVLAGAHAFGARRVRMLASDAVLAHGLTRVDDAETAILDLQGDRALLLLARGGRALVARRFKLPVPHTTQPDNAEDVAPFLMGEISRSLAFFREQGKGQPVRLILSGPCAPHSPLVPALGKPVGLPVTTAQVLAVTGFDPACSTARACLVPLLALRCGARAVPHLVEPRRTPPLRLALRIGLQVAGAAGCIAGGFLWRAAGSSARRDELARAERVRAAVFALQAEVDDLRAARRPPALVRTRQAILGELDAGAASRSALCAAVAAGRPESLALTRLELASDGTLAIAGIARTDDRLAALRALAELEAHLRSVPGLRRARSSLGAAAGGQRIEFAFTAHLGEEDS